MSIFGDIKIVVQTHAVYQFVLRFPDEAPTNQEDLERVKQKIEAEVRDALDHLRVSPHKPPSLFPPDDPECLYAWTRTQGRIYALVPDSDVTLYAVKTVMKAER